MKLIITIFHAIGRPCEDIECETPACVDAHRQAVDAHRQAVLSHVWRKRASNGVRTCPFCETCVQANELHCPVCDREIALAASNDHWLRGR